jgi:hypothetical protein
MKEEESAYTTQELMINITSRSMSNNRWRWPESYLVAVETQWEPATVVIR